MKTGEAAKLLGVDPATVRNWIDNEDISHFFSTSARGEDGSTQRYLNESDILILNTVRDLRAHQVQPDWNSIAEALEKGERVQEFPQNAISADPRVIPLPQAEQSARAAATMAERDAALARTSELENLLARKEAEVNQLHEKYRKEMLELQDRSAKERMEDQREIGRLQMHVEMLRKQIEELKGKGSE